MGLSLFGNCSSTGAGPAPNPDPRRWELLGVWQADKAYVLHVRYLDCTNFEGRKVMVYRGRWLGIAAGHFLDPHFTEDLSSPVARFRPDAEGWELACQLARSL